MSRLFGFTLVALSLVLPAVMTPTGATAQTPLSVSAELPLKSRYLFAGIPFSTGWVQQAQLSVNRGGFTVYGFTTFDFDLTEISEADIYADFYRQVSPQVGIYVGGAFYNFDFGPDAGGWQGTPELYAGMVLATALNPSLLIAHDFDLGDGTHALVSLSHSIPAGESGVTVEFGGNLDYNWEYWTSASGFSYGDVSAGLGIPLGQVTLSPKFVLQRRLSDDFTGWISDDEVFVVTAAFTF
jgi:hypothetical protein